MDRKAEDSTPDEELVRRFLDGDESAFDQVVLRHQREIYRVAWRITRDHAEADDLAQETFCRAYTALHEFRGDSSLRTWLSRIATHLSLNSVQSARVARREPIRVEDLADSSAAGAVEPIGPQRLIRKEREAQLRAAIEALPRRQRATLMLRAFEGMPYKEIARAMGCSIGTAKANFFHAVAYLKRAVKEPQ